MPKVSVIIPAYNAMAYLPETVESVLQQTFTDFEILIIDDGSTDSIQEWSAQITDPRVRVISQNNQGISAARNTGVANAQGDYIAFIDSDDLWVSTKLARQVQCLDAAPEVGLVHTWAALIDEQSQPTGNLLISDAEGHVWEQMVQRNSVATLTVMIRRQCFEKIGNFDIRLRTVEDWDMWIRMADHYPFALIKEPLALYRHSSNSLSKNYLIMQKDFQQVIEKTFSAAPLEFQYLKSRGYGYASLCLAWKALQCRDRDYKQAITFQHQAIAYYPQLRYSKESLRLSVAISLVRWLGSNGYSRFLTYFFSVRRRFIA
jgi:glycosyltransferase involved in cell wall biosynthesis